MKNFKIMDYLQINRLIHLMIKKKNLLQHIVIL